MAIRWRCRARMAAPAAYPSRSVSSSVVFGKGAQGMALTTAARSRSGASDKSSTKKRSLQGSNR
jgi:hypothetical protein